MRLPWPGGASITDSSLQRLLEAQALQWSLQHGRQAALTHTSPPSVSFRPEFLTGPDASLELFFSLPGWLGLTDTAPTRKPRRRVLVGKEEIVRGAFEAFDLLAPNYSSCYFSSWVRGSRRVRQCWELGDWRRGESWGRKRRKRIRETVPWESLIDPAALA